MIKRLILILFKSRYIGLYFWSKTVDAKQRARETVVGDILSIFAVILTVFIAILIKIGIISPFSLKHYPNSRIIVLILVGGISFLIGIRVNRYIKGILNKEDDLDSFCELDRHSKSSALPYFLFVLFSPLLYIVFYFLMLKLIVSHFFH